MIEDFVLAIKSLPSCVYLGHEMNSSVFATLEAEPAAVDLDLQSGWPGQASFQSFEAGEQQHGEILQ